MERLTMNCSSIRPLLSPFHDGELPPEQRAAVQDHVVACLACRHELASLSELSEMARSLRESPVPELWESIAMGLDDRSAAATHVPWARRFLRLPEARRRILWGTAAGVAALGILVLISWPRDHRTAEHRHMEVNLAKFVDAFSTDPAGAQQALERQYPNRVVEPDAVMSLVSYRPVAPDQLPGGLSRESVRVFDMPCCKCVQSLYRSPQGGPVAVFEHVNDEPAWFGGKPSITATCCGQAVTLVECGEGLCAAWKGGGRFLTVVGVKTVEELHDVIAGIELDSGDAG
jgi:hypothetical protein